MLAPDDDTAIADENLLTGTGSGGIFTSGYLRDRPLIEYLEESERVVHLLSNKKKGVRTESEDEGHAYTPGDGYQAMAAVTDTRVLFVVGDCDDGDAVFAVPYTEIEQVKTERGVLKKRLDVWTTEGVRWQFYVGGTVDLEPAADYVDRAAVVWSRVEGQLRHARKHVAEIDEAVDDGNHETARAAVTRARDYVEEAQRKAPDLSTDRSDAIWERIRETERRLDGAVMSIHASEADQQVMVAHRKWRDCQYNQAYDSFLAARNQYERALDVARDHDLPDADEMRDRRDEVTRTLDRLSKSPLRRAEQAYDRAESQDEPTIAIDHLEDALEKYQAAMVLDWGTEDQRFAGDTETLRERVEAVVDEIVSTRRTLAAERRAAGDEFADEESYARARQRYAQARGQLERARAVADELKPDVVAALDDEIDAVAADEAAAEEQSDCGGFLFVGDERDDGDHAHEDADSEDADDADE